jgi:hypothetical protein
MDIHIDPAMGSMAVVAVQMKRIPIQFLAQSWPEEIYHLLESMHLVDVEVEKNESFSF